MLSFKTHKLTALTAVSQPEKTTIGDLKREVLSALQADVLRKQPDDMDLVPDFDPEGEWTVPTVETTDDFELSRAVKERGRPTGEYDLLSNNDTVKQSLMNWETLFIRFRDENGECFGDTAHIQSHCCQSLIYCNTNYHMPAHLYVHTWSSGNLLPVKVALPSIADVEEEEPAPAPAPSKGKRKAGPEDFSD